MNYLCEQNAEITYLSQGGLSLRLMMGSGFSLFSSTNNVIRFNLGAVKQIHYYNDILVDKCHSLAPPPSQMRTWEMHVYIVAPGFQIYHSSWQQKHDHCAEYGANILTFDDQYEVHYFVQNIMSPFGITFNTIGAMRQVWPLVNYIMKEIWRFWKKRRPSSIQAVKVMVRLWNTCMSCMSCCLLIKLIC